MVPNHLFQILTLVAMEPPAHLGADAIRDEKGKVLRSIPPWSPEEAARAAVRGQYGPGRVEPVGRVPGYTDEESVGADSTTETFVALRIEIESWRWAGVPFYLRTGKRLARRRSEVVVKFRCPPLQLFRDTPVDCLESNHLAIRIQPNEGISLGFQAKRPGPEMTLGPVDMGFDYARHFEKPLQTAYATLLLDAMEGDPTLFQRADNVEAGWSVVQPLLEAWASPSGLEDYAAGSEGPEAARALLDRDGRSWHPLA
jgi:glucose-6-phosphate 1-dehydrogenase